MFRRPLEIGLDHLPDGVTPESARWASWRVSSLFIGMVMTIQFAFGLRRFGGASNTSPRVVVPILRARARAYAHRGHRRRGRIGSGMAAEVGAHERDGAGGRDPCPRRGPREEARRPPRRPQRSLVMPILGILAFALGTLRAVFICRFQFGISEEYFHAERPRDSADVGLPERIGENAGVQARIISIVGCHFGLRTTGGTEVGLSTTRTVVVVSIAILVADFMMTKLSIVFTPT